jgi:hypothetical protein
VNAGPEHILSQASDDWGTIASMFRRLVFSFSAILVLLNSVAGIATYSPVLAQQGNAKPAAPAPAVFNFTVKITYSQKAMDTLVAVKETVIVAGYLSASPITGTPKQYVDRMGEIGLGQVNQEIAPAAIATFSNVKPTPAMMKWVDSQGPQLLINVYSGRKSSPNNLLDCGIYEGSFAAVQGQSIPISCKLIGE